MESSQDSQNSSYLLLEALGYSQAVMEARAAERLDQIRRTSNVIQALENLFVQCEHSEAHKDIRELAARALEVTQRQMRQLIHVE